MTSFLINLALGIDTVLSPQRYVVFSDFVHSIDDWLYTVALFNDLSKAFDTVDHKLLKNCYLHIGLSHKALGWFENNLLDRQCLQARGLKPSFLIISNGVPQGTVLRHLLFCIYVKNLCLNVQDEVCIFMLIRLCCTY